MKGTTVDGFCRLGASNLYNTSARFGAQITRRIKAMKMDEYLRYLGTQTASRQIFLLNFAADFHSFEILYKMLRAAWAHLGSERDKSGESPAGLLPFANILARSHIDWIPASQFLSKLPRLADV